MPCGSMHKGHLLELFTIIPLSTEKLSTGKPAICQLLILTGSPRVTLREKFSEQGIFFDLHNSDQFFMHSFKIKLLIVIKIMQKTTSELTLKKL
jgi:hypothetical protein